MENTTVAKTWKDSSPQALVLEQIKEYGRICAAPCVSKDATDEKLALISNSLDDLSDAAFTRGCHAAMD